MKTTVGLFLFAFLLSIQGLQAGGNVGNSGTPPLTVAMSADSGYYLADVSPAVPVTPAVTPEVKVKPPLPPGGIIVVLRAYLPKIPDLSKMSVQPADAKEQPRQMKPSEWLKEQKVSTIEWVPTDRPTFVYFPKDWNSTVNNKYHLEKGLKLSAPASMEFKATDGKVIKLEGAMLYQVEGAFSDEAELLKSYPQPASLAGKPAHEHDIMIVDAKTGTFGSAEKNDIGEFTTVLGPLEDGWSDQRQEQALKFITDTLAAMGCFIATAVYHTPAAPQLNALRDFRDKVLMTSPEGAKLVAYYYQHGPYWARDVSHHPAVQALLRPIFSGVSFALGYMNLDSPVTQKVFHVVVTGVEWMVSPFISNQPQPAPVAPVGG